MERAESVIVEIEMEVIGPYKSMNGPENRGLENLFAEWSAFDPKMLPSRSCCKDFEVRFLRPIFR